MHLRLHNVSVRLPIYDANALRLFRRRRKPMVSGVGSHEFVGTSGVLEVQALKDISLSLESGDRLALIGHNGAGKTTLLRTMAGIYPTTSGTLEREGSVYYYGNQNIINTDASGYENIKLAMYLSHLPQNKLADYTRDIEEFTELGEYLDMPTRIYSAGMLARLAFAIATMHTPDVLLIDEGIGAGDSKFSDKVERRIHTFTQKARIMVVASHSNELLRKMCNKGAVFQSGHLLFVGGLEDALNYYNHSATSAAA